MAPLSPLERTTNPSNRLLSFWGVEGGGEKEAGGKGAWQHELKVWGGEGVRIKEGPGVSAHSTLNNPNLSPHTVSRSKGSPFSWPGLVQPALHSF